MITETEMIERAKACLVLGAIGDALGAPVEFLKRAEIVSQFGENGTQTFHEAYGVQGAVTDDTQMTLFLADGLLAAYDRGSKRGILGPYADYIAMSYIKWLQTQGETNGNFTRDYSYNLDEWGSTDLYETIAKQGRRGPGNTCLTALRAMPSPPTQAQNDSKGCGTVMRVAPIGIFFGSMNSNDLHGAQQIFDEAVHDATLTHGHVLAQQASGVLAVIIALCMRGQTFEDAVSAALQLTNSAELAAMCKQALALQSQEPSADHIKQLGEGWVAEEALAIGLYCAGHAVNNKLTTTQALGLATNHDGDSDSTGAITGALIGAALGGQGIDRALIRQDTEVGTLVPMLEQYGKALVTKRQN